VSRTVAWFSAGAASACAAKLALERDPSTVVARCIVLNEHPDNDRFAADVARWLGVEVVNLRSRKYRDAWEVWERRRYLNGTGGALCTTEMKKKVRWDFEQPGDVNVFGITWDEDHRAVGRFESNNPEVIARYPLIEERWTKGRCLYEIERAGIDLPVMYRLGYDHNNCIPCVKGGRGYFAAIREDFPEAFARMAAIEERLGASCINGQPLRTLPLDIGPDRRSGLGECGLFCGQNTSPAKETRHE
jgi:3'-phosphoadenosine 5'-phosphosulfate sulfotransferase (PAPS reductase)/FAD synthetase